MGSIAFADCFICTELIGHKMRVGIDQPDYPRLKRFNAVIVNQCRPHWTVSFNGDQHSLFMCAFSAFVAYTFLEPRFTTNVLFIQLNDTA